jgi:predicted acetyltransferase
MQTDLTLRLPREDEEEEFLRAHRATSPEVPYFLHFYKEGMPFSRYLDVLAEQERGLNLASTTFPRHFYLRFSERGSSVGSRFVTH